MDIIHHAAEMQGWSHAKRRNGLRIGFVPTMGFLHQGHLSLMAEAKRQADLLVVSIFVNPTQFGPNEDLDAYPRDAQRDERLCREQGADALFFPDETDMYPQGFETVVSLRHLPKGLCGRSRPIHFNGVATVVAKLFNIVQPDIAVFGEKDFQQLAVIRRLVKDLNFPITILGGATVREPDGLAMSSRNAYLEPHQREAALSLSKALWDAQAKVADGLTDAHAICEAAKSAITAHAGAEIDYVDIVDPETLSPLATIAHTARMVLAVKVGKTRLIDNIGLVVDDRHR